MGEDKAGGGQAGVCVGVRGLGELQASWGATVSSGAVGRVGLLVGRREAWLGGGSHNSQPSTA